MDERGRRVLLRGVNLGGSSKVPAGPPLGPPLLGGRDISFVGRPFPLAEAAEHFGRLRHWGFNCLRFLVTWEALEHAGPGEYDEDYLDYLYETVRLAGEYGLVLFIDPHQDVWSRMTGGDGAPGWTLELVGFDLARLDASEAAVTRAARWPDYGQMVWSSNRRRLAAATMFALFFAGARLAPHCLVAGENIQHFLQRHFLAAMSRVAERLAGLPHVLGYGSMNEPGAGYIGLPSLSAIMPISNNGPLLTGFQSMTIPAGFPESVPYQERRGVELVRRGEVLLNPAGVSAWRMEGDDVWRRHGVWGPPSVPPNGGKAGGGVPRLLRDDYFAGLDFHRDCLLPFARRYARAIRAADPRAILFIEGEPHNPGRLPWGGAGPVVNAAHWYDSLTTRTKHYDPERAINTWTGEVVHGRAAVRQAYADQIGALVRQSAEDFGGVPTLIGEFGLPFDLNGGAAYRSGDWSAHKEALAAYYDALDAHLAHATLWNYTADNDNRWGDHWNGEDFSIFSRDQQADPADPDSGGRAVAGFCRPTVRAAAGEPLAQRYDHASGRYELVIDAEPEHNPTLVYVPRRLLAPAGEGWEGLSTTSGAVAYRPEEQLLVWQCAAPGVQTLRLKPETGATSAGGAG